MPDDVPDLSPGSSVGELSHAAQAAVQISSMRREAADRRGLEALRAAEDQVTKLDRVRSEWERLRRASEAALQLANDTRFEANHAMRVAAFSRQHSDGAVLEYGDALQAPSGAVSQQELRRLEREVQLTARRAEVDTHLAERAVRACSKAGGQYDLVAFDQVKFEREYGIESTGHERGLHDAAARPETAAARLFVDRADADRWIAVAEAERHEATGEFSSGAEQFGIHDDLTTPVPEDDVADERGYVAVGRGTDVLAHADAASAAAGAARVAFTGRSGTPMDASASPPSPFKPYERGRTR